jgi:hypothetical protein
MLVWRYRSIEIEIFFVASLWIASLRICFGTEVQLRIFKLWICVRGINHPLTATFWWVISYSTCLIRDHIIIWHIQERVPIRLCVFHQLSLQLSFKLELFPLEFNQILIKIKPIIVHTTKWLEIILILSKV